MATINLGAIKFNWKGAYAGGTAYTVDDVVSSGGSSYVCILASTGNAVSNGTYWELMSSAGTNGTDGTDVGTTITTQGDILYRDGSGLQRLGAGTNGQALLTGGTGANPSWGTISSGTYSVHAIDSYNYQTAINQSNAADYHDIAGGNYVQFQPTSTNDLIYISHSVALYNTQSDTGCDVYMMMKEGSSAVGSGDTKLNYDGNHAHYISGTSVSYYDIIHKSFILPCTGLNTSSVYYLEQAGATHNANQIQFNLTSSNGSGSYKTHNVNLIHYKA
jgi:hypothetical protein